MEFREKYKFLSNMYKSPFTLDGIRYKTVEHFYQSHKTLNFNQRIEIINAQTPVDAKDLGKKCILRDDWSTELKLNIMRLGIKLKFAQNSKLAFQLLNIDEEIIEDNDWNDTFWGMSNGFGLNYLGKILEENRQRIKLRIDHTRFSNKYEEELKQ